MKRAACCLLVVLLLGWACAAQAALHLAGQKMVKGLGHPESVAYDPDSGSLYVSRFGPELKPLQKDGKGFISRADLSGKIVQERFLPGPGQVLHKPKGLWVDGGRLWATDIDSVWVFDLKSRKGKKLALPGAVFANDVVAGGGKLYVSDMNTGKLYLVEPADFLASPAKVSIALEQAGLAPNGILLMPDGGLLVGTMPQPPASGVILKLSGPGQKTVLAKDQGRLDGLALLSDGTILATDWATGSLFALAKDGTRQTLFKGLAGPADFGLVPQGQSYLVVLPDLVKGDLYFLTIAP